MYLIHYCREIYCDVIGNASTEDKEDLLTRLEVLWSKALLRIPDMFASLHSNEVEIRLLALVSIVEYDF